MKKKYLYTILIICLIISTTLITTIIIPSYAKYINKKEELKKIKTATILVELKEDLTTPFLSEVKVSDFITNINGDILNDYLIDTSKIGEHIINFTYLNEENIKVPYTYKINVQDKTAPVIWVNNTYSVEKGYDGSLLEDIVCADNYDDNPKCEILGHYNLNKIGEYPLTFKATDNAGNTTIKEFTLKVKEPINNQKSSSSPKSYTLFSDVIKEYKNEKTKIGIDVSSWQGNIDFQALKNAGVEFAFIRVGSTYGIDGEYFLDKKFIQNIEGFNKVGIPVGLYFYSYAYNQESAINDAKWVLSQIKNYKIDLPIAYDWESWSFYNTFHQSFYSTTMNAKSFLDTIKKAGYEGLLYSSKNYLENVWYDTGYDIWLAHYTNKTSYTGDYKYWQMCSNGLVDGINGNVDINIMYT